MEFRIPRDNSPATLVPKALLPGSPSRQQRFMGAPGFIQPKPKETIYMLMTIAIILIILWLLGLVTSVTMGGLIHILLVVAIIVVLVRVIQGRKVI